MTWKKNIKFLARTDEAWTADNPIIPQDAILFALYTDANDNPTGVRLKYGNGAAYNDTYFLDDVALAEKLDHPFGNGTDVIFADGTVGPAPGLTLQDLLDNYHLVSSEEWVELQKYSVPTPSFVATPTYNTNYRLIGDSLSGNFPFSFAKTNAANFKDLVGGNISVNQGTFTNTGNFDLQSDSSRTLIGTNPTFTEATVVTFTLQGVDAFDQVIDVQTFDIEFKYPIYAGTNVSKNISGQGSLSNFQQKDAADLDGLEFQIDALGVNQYFHVLTPPDISGDMDIRLQEIPGFGSANMILYETINLTIGSISKTYNHYVTDYTSAGQINLLLRNT